MRAHSTSSDSQSPHEGVHSFDVYDTLLMRFVGKPRSLFRLLASAAQSQGILSISPEDFRLARIQAETDAKMASPSAEITLELIYSKFAQALHLSPEVRERLMALELDLETRLLVPVPPGRHRLEQARAHSRSVLFLSDMYLPADFVRRQLSRHGLLADGDRCYVSSQSGRTKAEGSLFMQALAAEKLEPPQLLHCGDNKTADIRTPAQLGIRTEPLLSCRLNRYEEILEDHAAATAGFSSLLAGSSRYARLCADTRLEPGLGLSEVAAGVIAPTLIAYVLWILRTAEEKGWRRLYFISRDGQVLLKIARCLNAKLQYPLELRYLYGSRQAFLPATLDRIDEQHLQWILAPADGLSPARAMARMGLSCQSLASTLIRCGLREPAWTSPFTPGTHSCFLNFLHSDELADRLAKEVTQKRELLTRYLRQEKLMDDRRAIVDLGWSGRLQKSLSHVLSLMGGRPIDGLYFGLTADAPPEGYAYFYDRRSRQGFLHDVPRLKSLMEIFCAADHGMVTGYRVDGNQVVPTLREDHAQAVRTWGLNAVRTTVYRFALSLDWQPYALDPHVDFRPAIRDLLRAFWLTPSAREAASWAAFPYEDEQAGGDWTPLARPLKWADLPKIAAAGKLTLYRGFWPAGALQLSSRPLRHVATAVAAIGGMIAKPLRR